VRILSLLPSATEVVFLLGLGDQLVGATHECDWPPEARSVRRVSWSNLPPGAEPAEIDRLVSESARTGASIYELDRAAVRELQPDLVLTQDLCAVCAVPAGHLRAALDALGCDPEVVSLDPSSLDEVLACIVTVGKATGTEPKAEEAVERLRARLERVRDAVAGRSRPRTLALEWGDPPYNAGHWVPEMIEVAGGEPLLASAGVPSSRLAWPDVAASDPAVVVFMPCGYNLEAARAECQHLAGRPELSGAGLLAAANAGAYFSRPGPRLVDGVEALASLLHPGAVTPRVGDAVAALP
jgi:iron complex transport system substrate-binding protein